MDSYHILLPTYYVLFSAFTHLYSTCKLSESQIFYEYKQKLSSWCNFLNSKFGLILLWKRFFSFDLFLNICLAVRVKYQIMQPYRHLILYFLWVLILNILESKTGCKIFLTEWQHAFPVLWNFNLILLWYYINLKITHSQW